MLRPHHALLRVGAMRAAQIGGAFTGGSLFLALSQQPLEWRWAWGVFAGLCLVAGAIVAVRYIPYGEDD